MGNIQGLPANVCLDDFLNDLAEIYPGLELQLEESYKCCAVSVDGEDEGLPYKDVEPIIRHHLMMAGTLELLTRVTNNGVLDLREILGGLHAFGIDINLRKNLKLDDWKILLVAWVRKLQEEQIKDLEEWHSKLSRLQRKQEVAYDQAVRLFQSTYMKQLEAFYGAVEKEYKEEEAYRRQWEESQEVQERFFEKQEDFLEQQNALADRNFAERSVMFQHQYFIQLMHEIGKKQIIPMSGANRTFTYAYPAQLTAPGAPVSAGCKAPSFRGFKPQKLRRAQQQQQPALQNVL